jgi:SAM-dependent methyltransferase
MKVHICPACQSKEIRPQSPYPFRQAGNVYLPDHYSLMVCNACNLWFKENIPSRESLKSHYEELSVESSSWDYSKRLPHEKKLDQVLSALPDNSRVLDVGCWTGRLLSLHYPRLEVYGIEPNLAAAKFAQDKGLKILGAEVTGDLALDGFFQCITMVDVFEHLPEPMPVIENLLNMLAPSGKLLIVTGRTDCFPVLLASSSYWYFSCSDHLIFINKKFSHWLEDRFIDIHVRYIPISHFDFQLSRFIFELNWLICWRFLSPNSPFPKPEIYNLPGFKSFQRLKETMVCSAWRDHTMLQIEKECHPSAKYK